ncbi:putative bifunctional diguanylate cyclase/phosphodiesterase [Cryobacterium roopkundense]|uniref:Diguanylate cyclase (GGDEF)-like protein n=1 Tax=Cryobacterium roopkundense TaxID=1001240 RepID=A0A7W8ZUB6_9MICO|nr:EAL domain-containing protein [Cryobacterium roopkundense]MBB5640070.1 diguanylate cyclase (GGDEF)-like protein [Cryobacterium roopkundense]
MSVAEGPSVMPQAPDRVRAGMIIVMGVVVLTYLVGLMLNGDQFHPLIDGFLGILVVWSPVVVCWLAVARAIVRRANVLLAAAAVTSFAAGDTFYVAVTGAGVTLPFPSLADIGYLAFYPLMLAALAVPVIREWKHVAWPVILDGAVGSLGSAAILAVVLNPILGQTVNGQLSVPTVVAVAYPMFDLLLVAAFVGIGASQGRSVGRWWSLLVLGLVAFAATDITYALQQLSEGYDVGGPVDAGWAVGLALIALWIEGVARPGSERSFSVWSIPSQTVPTIATAAAVAVLVLGSQMWVSPLAVALAAVTLTLAAVPLVFRQRIRLAAMQLQARTDELTGLPNRRALHTDVPVRLAGGGRRRSALLVLDLDKFKVVYDSLGHDCGDQLLILVAERLQSRVRPADLLARLGGDEFAVHLVDGGRDEATLVAGKLARVLADPFVLADVTVQIGVSIGISLYPEHGSSLNVLMRKADMAMYRAKESRTGCHIYRDTDDAASDERIRALQEVREAVTGNELALHFQPTISVETGEVAGVQALLRWNHPVRGHVYPDELLPLVEEAKLTSAVTRIVLGHALDQATVWLSQGRDWTVSVSVPAISLREPDFPECLRALVSERGLAPHVLILDVSEDFLMTDRAWAKEVLLRLQGVGVRIALDDFGSGYSSLSYLRDLPIDDLKLGSSFISPMDENPRAVALVASAIGLAHSLGLRLIAEGVESSTTYAYLARHGCDVVQGPFVAGPLSAAQIDVWLASRAPGATLPAKTPAE